MTGVKNSPLTLRSEIFSIFLPKGCILSAVTDHYAQEEPHISYTAFQGGKYTANISMKSTKIHYAWVVLFGCTLMFFTIAGLSGNVYPVYSPFIMEQYGFSKTKISMISSLASLASTVSVLLTTSLYSKVSLRNGMLLAGLLNAAAFGLFGLADSFPVFLAASFLKGFSYGLGSLVPIAKIIENWFHTKRTLALSIVSAASGLATIGIPSLVTRIIQHYGIHISFYSNAVTFALIYLICWLLIRDDPSEMGLTAYEGAEKRKKTRETKEVKPLPSSWWNFLSVALLFATSAVSCFSNLSMLTSTEGFKPETVALVVSVSGASLMTGKLLFGVF